MPHHHEEPLQIGQCARAVDQRIGARLHERRAQQQILGRIAAQTEFGREHELCAMGVSASRHSDDERTVARQITDRGVDLRQGHFDRRLC